MGLRVHVSHRVRGWLPQPLVPRVEGLESVLDPCSGLCGAAQAGCDLRPRGGDVSTSGSIRLRTGRSLGPHLSVNEDFLPQTEDLRRRDGDGGASGAERGAGQRDSGFWSSFHGQTQQVQERPPCVSPSHFSQS